MAIVDLSHRLEDGMAAYPGLPPARIEVLLDHDASRERYEGKAEFLLGRVAIAGNTGTYLDAPFLPAGAVDRLVSAGAALVGVDFGNVDDTSDLARPAHTGLLQAAIPIVENLRGLGRLPREGFTFSAPPLALVGGAAFPVRAFAEVP